MRNSINFTAGFHQAIDCTDIDYEKMLNGFYKTLNFLTAGIVLVNNEGCALFINEAAQSIINKKTCIKLSSNGLILGVYNRATIVIRKLITDAIAIPSGEMTHVSLRNISSTMSLTLAALHLQNSANQHLPCAALYIIDQESYQVVPCQVLCDLYGLTKREAELAAALARGMRVSDFAIYRNISLNTVNTQLKSIMGKTCTSRQSDLIRLIVTSFPYIS